jgi:cation transport ATPase
MNTCTLDITGMTCASCVRRVEKALVSWTFSYGRPPLSPRLHHRRHAVAYSCGSARVRIAVTALR